MRITAATIRDYMRVREVQISPAADRSVLLIVGRNRQGKTSIFNALRVAFGGKDEQAADPVRHGADQAFIEIVLDDGELVIRRIVERDGKTTLELRDRNGTVRSPQAVLDRIIGTRFLDPFEFVQLKAKDQRARLLKLIDGDGKIAGLDERRQSIFDRRTEVGRERDRADGEFQRLPPEAAGPAAIDVVELAAEQSRLAELRVAVKMAEADADARARALSTAETAGRHLVDRIAELERELAAHRDKLPLNQSDLESARAAADEGDVLLRRARDAAMAVEPRRAELDAAMARANDVNRLAAEASALNRRREAAKAQLEQHVKQYQLQTNILAKIEAEKSAALAAARLPVEGLGFDADGMTFRGVPFEQASGAEKLQVALALAIATSPGLDDVWIRDGALLDDDSLRMIGEHAEATGARIWIERVGTSEGGAIVIEDGRVVGEPAS